MTKSLTLWLILVASVLAVPIGCKDDEHPKAMDLMTPVALDKYIVYIDKNNEAAYFVDVVGKKLKARAKRVELGPGPLLSERRKSPSVSELLLLCQGKQAEIEEPYQAPELIVLDAGGVDRRYPLKSRFNAMVQSDDGELAILYYQESDVKTADSELTRRNQVAIINLSKPAAEGDAPNPAVRELKSDDGSAPRAVTISPLISVAGQSRRLAVTIFENQVSILDLTHLGQGRKEITVPFDLRVASSPVLFGSNAAAAAANGVPLTSTLYLRSEQSDEIYIVDLLPVTGKSNDFWPTINLRKSGALSSDMALYQEPAAGDTNGASDRLLVVSATGQKVSVLDPATGNINTISLGFAADRVLMYRATAPFDQTEAPRAFLYNAAGFASQIAFLDLVGVQDRPTQNLEIKPLAKTFSSLLTVAGEEGVAVLVEQGSGVSLLDLADRTIDPIQTGQLSAVIPDAAAKTLWLPFAPLDSKRIELGFIEMDTHLTGSVLLDAAIEKIIPVSAGEQNRVVVIHPSKVGYLTVIDAAQPERETAVSLQGFLLSDVLDSRK